MANEFANFADLARARRLDEHYRIVIRPVQNARIAVMTPHGGGIEPGTSDIATAIAGEVHSLYLFEGIMRANNYDLHITSHHFDEPRCLELLSNHLYVLAIHGCSGRNGDIYIGGRDEECKGHIARLLTDNGYRPVLSGHKFPGAEPDNICNRGARGVGVQLEMSRHLRDHLDISHFSNVIQSALSTLPAPQVNVPH